MEPLVTIGIPTYNRPELLARALRAVAEQDYPQLEVLVADNATPGDSTAGVIDAFRGSISRLRYVRHERNIGPIANFMFLLAEAQGRYFMWLADDDEISPNYVSSLAGLLEMEPDASSAMGGWVLMQDEAHGRLVKSECFPQKSAVVRALRFVWRSEDSFFYALHRTDVLRTARFSGYSWPNRDVLTNWAYVYLFDVVLSGRVLTTSNKSVQFINHDYTSKAYALADRSVAGAAVRACRRTNVHLLYWQKSARRLSSIAIALIMATSVVSLVREGAGNLARRAARAVSSRKTA